MGALSKKTQNNIKFKAVYQKEVMIFGLSSQILENALRPELFHQIPIFNNSMTNGILKSNLEVKFGYYLDRIVSCGRRQCFIANVEVKIGNFSRWKLSDVIFHCNRRRYDHLWFGVSRISELGVPKKYIKFKHAS
jgi:hypothetical protein